MLFLCGLDGLSLLSTIFSLCEPLKNATTLSSWLEDIWFNLAMGEWVCVWVCVLSIIYQLVLPFVVHAHLLLLFTFSPFSISPYSFLLSFSPSIFSLPILLFMSATFSVSLLSPFSLFVWIPHCSELSLSSWLYGAIARLALQCKTSTLCVCTHVHIHWLTSLYL